MNVSRIVASGLVLAAALTSAVVVAQVPNNYTARPDYATQPTEPQQLAQQFVNAANDDDKRDIRKKLSEALSRQFDSHIKEQKSELQELEKKIADLRALLNKRQEAKASIVERRIEQLLQDAEGLGWNAPAAPRYTNFGSTQRSPFDRNQRSTPAAETPRQ
jgi:phosphomevalonate kinase